MLIKKKKVSSNKRIKRRGGIKEITKISELEIFTEPDFFTKYEPDSKKENYLPDIKKEFFANIPKQSETITDEMIETTKKILNEIFKNYSDKYEEIYGFLKRFKESYTADKNLSAVKQTIKDIFKDIFKEDINIDLIPENSETDICKLLLLYINFIKNLKKKLFAKRLDILGIGFPAMSDSFIKILDNFEEHKNLLKINEKDLKLIKQNIKKESVIVTDTLSEEETTNQFFQDYQNRVIKSNLLSTVEWVDVTGNVDKEKKNYEYIIKKFFVFKLVNGNYDISINSDLSSDDEYNKDRLDYIKKILESIILKEYYTKIKQKVYKKFIKIYEDIVKLFIEDKLDMLKKNALKKNSKGEQLYHDTEKQKPKYDQAVIIKFINDELNPRQGVITPTKGKSFKELEDLILVLLAFINILKSNEEIPKPKNFTINPILSNTSNGLPLPPLPPRPLGPPLPPLPPRPLGPPLPPPPPPPPPPSTSVTTSVTSGLRSNKSETLMISDEIKINKKFILKSLKYNIYLLILDNYNANKKLYIYLLKDLINNIFNFNTFSNINIYKIMFKASKLYEQFIQKCLVDPSTISLSTDDDVAKYEKYFKLLLHFMFWTNYISAYNMYALSCIQVFVLLVDDKSEINVFNYINLIFHLSCDLSKTYLTLRENSKIPSLTHAPATQDTSLSDYLEEIKILLHDIDDTTLDTDSTTNIQDLITKLNGLLLSPTSPPTQSETDNQIKKNIISKLKKILEKRDKDLKKLEDLTRTLDDSTAKNNAELEKLKSESQELENLINEINKKTKMDELMVYLNTHTTTDKVSPNIKKIITKILELYSKEGKESSGKLLSAVEKINKLEGEKTRIFDELRATKDMAGINEPDFVANEEEKKIFYLDGIRKYLEQLKAELEAAKAGTGQLEKAKAELQAKKARTGDLEVELEDTKRTNVKLSERLQSTALLLQQLINKIKQLNDYIIRGDIYYYHGKDIKAIFTSTNTSKDYHMLNADKLENPNEPLFIPLTEEQKTHIQNMETDEAKKLKAKLEEISTKMVVKGKKDNVTGMTVFNNEVGSTDYYTFNVSGNSEDHKIQLRDPNQSLFKPINYSQVVDDVTETTEPAKKYTKIERHFYQERIGGPEYQKYTDQYNNEYYLKNGNYVPYGSSSSSTYTPPVTYYPPSYSPYSYRGGGNKENISEVAILYSNLLNIQSSTTIETTVPAELEEYKKSVNQDCENNKPSENYINAILDLHTGFSLNKKKTTEQPFDLYNMVVLQLNLLSTVNINKCALYNFIKFCNENKDKAIYTFDGEKFVTYIQVKQKAS
jgi:hypothetical protein